MIVLQEPLYYKDIFKLRDKDKWLEAVKNELDNMKNMNVYKVINKIPEGANIISSRWIFKYKRDADGNIVKRKARLVARGFTQNMESIIKTPFLLHSNLTLLGL